MKKQYKKIEFGLGNIESAVKELSQYKERGELVCGECQDYFSVVNGNLWINF